MLHETQNITVRMPVDRQRQIDAIAQQGATLVDYWQQQGLIGSRSDIEDSQSHARQLRKHAATRHKRP